MFFLNFMTSCTITFLSSLWSQTPCFLTAKICKRCLVWTRTRIADNINNIILIDIYFSNSIHNVRMLIQVVGCDNTSEKLFVLVMNVYVATQEKHFFIHVIVALDLLGHQTLHSQNKHFFPSCTIYYFQINKFSI